jgi:hypothetical protein
MDATFVHAWLRPFACVVFALYILYVGIYCDMRANFTFMVHFLCTLKNCQLFPTHTLCVSVCGKASRCSNGGGEGFRWTSQTLTQVRPVSQSVSFFTAPPRAHPSTGSQSGSATPRFMFRVLTPASPPPFVVSFRG